VTGSPGTHRTVVRAGTLVDAATVAEYLAVERSWVYEHADELNARRLGSGPKARLRFSLSEVDERLTACTAGRESVRDAAASPVALRKRRCHALGTNVDLLPIGGVKQRSRAA
jgi:predicted DNA-binding transcriptional regulator AlpA